MKFAFDECKGSTLTLGICLGSRPVIGYFDKIVTKNKLEENKLEDDAGRSVSFLLNALDDILDNYTELSRYGIELDIRVCGYALGGLVAQALCVNLQDWSACKVNNLKCRTYESPGLPPCFHKQAGHYTEEDKNYWNNRIKNYKSMPNPANTAFKDIGSVFHLMHFDKIVADKRWIRRCLAGATGRGVFYSAVVFSGLQAAGYTAAKVATETIAIAGAAALLGHCVSELGLEQCELVALHKLEAMDYCFDSNGNLRSEACHEMRRWPHYKDFSTVLSKTLAIGRSFVPFHPDNPGMISLFWCGGKKGFVARKLNNFPGYERRKAGELLQHRAAKKKTV